MQHELEQIAQGIDSGVELWAADLDGSADRMEELAALLSRDERRRACRFRFDRDRRRFVICRGLLRRVLASRLDVPPDDIEFSYGPFGKPVVSVPGEHSLTFNLAHADGRALIAISADGEIGVDIERVRPLSDLEGLAAVVLSQAERATLSVLPIGDRVTAFFNAWTRKEAYIKARGDGLQRPLDGFDVTLAPGDPVRLIRVRGEPDEPARWKLSALEPGPGFVAAVCFERQSLCS